MGPGDDLRDVGDWLSITFRIVKERAGHLFTLVVALSLPVGLIVSYALWQVFRDMNLTIEDDASIVVVNGPSSGEWVLTGVITMVSVVVSMAAYGAMQRQTMAALLERPEPWSKSLAEGLAKAPKLLGNYLLLVLAFIAVVVVISVLAVINGLLGILGFIGLFGLVFVAMGRLFMFMPAATCSPSGTPTIKTTLRLSKNHTVSLIGRALLIVLIFIGIGLASSIVTAPFAQGAATPLDPNTTTFNFNDFLGDNLPQFALLQVIGSLINGIGIAIAAAATSVVYKDRNGPIDPALGLDPEPAAFS